MFTKKFLHLIFFIIPLLRAEISASTAIINNFEYNKDCLIHNYEYRFEYLFSSKNENKTKQSEVNKNKNDINLVPLGKVNNFNSIRWSLIETKNQSEQFFLKSSFYGDYLCASFKFADYFHTRRLLVKVDDDSNDQNKLLDNCKWKINRIDSKKSTITTYSIMNVHFNQPMYAASYFFQRKIDQRDVFLWHNKKNVNSKKFKWIIDCKSGDYLWI